MKVWGGCLKNKFGGTKWKVVNLTPNINGVNKTESVKIAIKTVAKVRKQKKVSGINVGRFFELAALEKLERDKNIVTVSASMDMPVHPDAHIPTPSIIYNDSEILYKSNKAGGKK